METAMKPCKSLINLVVIVLAVMPAAMPTMAGMKVATVFPATAASFTVISPSEQSENETFKVADIPAHPACRGVPSVASANTSSTR